VKDLISAYDTETWIFRKFHKHHLEKNKVVSEISLEEKKDREIYPVSGMM
jgi:hypothetical protein